MKKHPPLVLVSAAFLSYKRCCLVNITAHFKPVEVRDKKFIFLPSDMSIANSSVRRVCFIFLSLYSNREIPFTVNNAYADDLVLNTHAYNKRSEYTSRIGNIPINFIKVTVAIPQTFHEECITIRDIAQQFLFFLP